MSQEKSNYQASPRPSFDQTTLIRYDTVTRHLWGDDEAGRVADWIYVSSQEIHQIVFGVAPGGSFRHSEAYRTIFGADEVFLVLEGEMAMSNPETGEVHLVKQGEFAFFRKDTWHHAHSVSKEALRVLEFFAPPPATGTSGAYAKTKPYVSKSNYTQDEFIHHWIPTESMTRKTSIQVIREQDMLWRLEAEQTILIGIVASTEHLTVGKMRLLPGQRSNLHTHAGAESIYVTQGTLNILAMEDSGKTWLEANPKDGAYIPTGVAHQYYNYSADIVEFVFGVAPGYKSSQ
jgi:quercetin dioxygenase-like cupin family protein